MVELGVPGPPDVPTRATCGAYLALRAEVIAMLELRKTLQHRSVGRSHVYQCTHVYCSATSAVCLMDRCVVATALHPVCIFLQQALHAIYRVTASAPPNSVVI